MSRTVTDDDLFKIITIISYESSFDLNNLEELGKVKRPEKGPPLLLEIINILEITCHPAHPDVLARASQIRDSNTSIASNRSKKRETIPLNEPALNILQTLSNLRQTANGISDGPANVESNKRNSRSFEFKKLSPSSRFYDECLYYVTSYGSHLDIINFLVKHDQIFTALKYIIYQTVDSEIFVQAIFLPYLKRGRTDAIIMFMMEIDETLLVWKDHIIQTCRYLERRGLLNSLYHLQILLKDPVRASMTCVKFYSMGCSKYTELLSNAFHLVNAQKHLQSELELCQWEEIKVVQAPRRIDEDGSLLMKMDPRTLNSHINTIWRQIEVTKFLAKCEQAGRNTVELLSKVNCVFVSFKFIIRLFFL